MRKPVFAAASLGFEPRLVHVDDYLIAILWGTAEQFGAIEENAVERPPVISVF